MKNVMGVINLVNELDHLEQLTQNRSVASVPFGGRYRLIDFILSSYVNSGIHNVSVFAHTKYRSLMDHLGSGKEWDLDRKRNGLFLLPPDADEIKEIAKGDLYHFYCNRDYFARSTQEYVVISRSHMVCNVDFRDVLRFHEERGADITVIYKNDDQQQHAKVRNIEVDGEGRVLDMQDHTGRLRTNNISMEMYVLRKSLLLDLVETALAQGYDHLIRDALMKNTDRLRIFAYEYTGYLGVVNTIMSYYHHSMQMLSPTTWRDLFSRPGPIFTKIKDEPPTRYGAEARVHNSLIANGCVIEGKVENCILFRGVKVQRGAALRNCIVLQNSRILAGARLDNAILDKDCLVTEDRMLIGDPRAPFIAEKRKSI